MFKILRSIIRRIFKDPIVIHLYYSICYQDRVFIRGRVLQDKIVLSHMNDGPLKSLMNMVKRMMTDEKRNRLLMIDFDELTHEIFTDAEGYYETDFKISDKNASKSKHKDIVISTVHAKSVKSIITSISDHAEYGVISDIDDTIMMTGVTSFFKWRLMINTFFVNPWRRKTFDNINEVFHALKAGTSSEGNHPIFYISNSPWNLFDYLTEYLRSKNFPNGTLFLRDINIRWFGSRALEEKNKFKEIVKVMDICSNLPFILIGDSGEIDSDIYFEILKMYPDRIKAVYIREIPSSKRLREIEEVLEKMGPKGLLFKKSQEVVTHATSLGLIH